MSTTTPTRSTRSELRSVAGLADGLRPAVMRLARRLRQVRADGLELTASQLSAMGTLARADDQPIGTLAAAERVAAPSMTRVVNALQERGLVVRTPDPTDRRQSLVSLTTSGRELLLLNRRRRSEWLAQRIAELDPDDREVLRRAVGILERINAA
ncbi:MarR family winged helix-turn-helix transcriptional regulator [Microlunatus antarcticus]|uniref:DNA-binding MarR family transcriptional regulator n=1 Tax=Microlunatus antarcticus TaxID=53388 RepID=A0A7W5JSK2_9ACTN|nr:MarR family transcriptional regulator [Microlunatus antarcticus]MBB3325545.1 DNA-binding MarR family transcriptional regulator [Microlunatus antarcticus]